MLSCFPPRPSHPFVIIVLDFEESVFQSNATSSFITGSSFSLPVLSFLPATNTNKFCLYTIISSCFHIAPPRPFVCAKNPPVYCSFMMIKGKPCKVLSISVSKTGKHGHAKCNFVATDIFTGKKYEDMIPSTHGTTVPVVNRSDWEIIDIGEDDGELTLMDEAGNQKTDLNLPTYPEEMADQIREAWNGGENTVVVTVQAAVGIEQVISFKKESS